mmetsp:Transcript_690/g.2196  ORF Transcript_690/g.2196 Transcript_690/m.2196 type:complete len:236 (+) Transcript_690:322-1029(+)
MPVRLSSCSTARWLRGRRRRSSSTWRTRTRSTSMSSMRLAVRLCRDEMPVRAASLGRGWRRWQRPSRCCVEAASCRVCSRASSLSRRCRCWCCSSPTRFALRCCSPSYRAASACGRGTPSSAKAPARLPSAPPTRRRRRRRPRRRLSRERGSKRLRERLHDVRCARAARPIGAVAAPVMLTAVCRQRPESEAEGRARPGWQRDHARLGRQIVHASGTDGGQTRSCVVASESPDID